ncbi:MAG: hypothetical protein WCP45_15870, partial [Verrucomicrobiota bacterium]
LTLALKTLNKEPRYARQYSYYRLQAWSCFDIDGEASSFWAFCDHGKGPGDWSPYLAASGSFTPYFLDPTSVTPSKAIEAIRAGAQDFEYLLLLKQAVAVLRLNKANPMRLADGQRLLDAAYQRVIDAPQAKVMEWAVAKPRTAADEVRAEIGSWLEQAEPAAAR